MTDLAALLAGLLAALPVAALHLGALHPVEKALTLALAFGPFVVLGIVIAIRRRREQDEPGEPGEQEDPAEPAPQRER